MPLQSTPKRERAFERHIAYAGIRQMQKLRFQLQAIQNFDQRRPVSMFYNPINFHSPLSKKWFAVCSASLITCSSYPIMPRSLMAFLEVALPLWRR